MTLAPNTKALIDALGRSIAWCGVYADMSRVAHRLLEVCPHERHAEMLAAIKAVHAKARKINEDVR